jgi:hypothetical protein
VTKVEIPVAAKKAAIVGAATLVPPYIAAVAFTRKATPVLGSASDDISGVERASAEMADWYVGFVKYALIAPPPLDQAVSTALGVPVYVFVELWHTKFVPPTAVQLGEDEGKSA